MSFTTRLLAAGDLEQMKRLLRMFGEAFDDPDSYQGAPPSDAYLRERLGDRSFFAVVAQDERSATIGGLAPTANVAKSLEVVEQYAAKGK